jgi:hypothetical protein
MVERTAASIEQSHDIKYRPNSISWRRYRVIDQDQREGRDQVAQFKDGSVASRSG